MKVAILLFLASLLPVSAWAATASINVGIAITADPLTLVFNPTNPTVPCNTPPGTAVMAITTSGGDGNAVALSMTANSADFALSATAPPANLIVGPAGIASPDCNTVETVSISASQP
jgi:hypothetical protein